VDWGVLVVGDCQNRADRAQGMGRLKGKGLRTEGQGARGER
jgi:hypothetical protein